MYAQHSVHSLFILALDLKLKENRDNCHNWFGELNMGECDNFIHELDSIRIAMDYLMQKIALKL